MPNRKDRPASRRKKSTSSGSSRKSRTPTKSAQQKTVRRRSSSSSSEPRAPLQRISKSRLCNLTFPVARVKSMLKVHNHGLRVSDKGAVFATGVLQYITTEILELSMVAARDEGRSRIQPRDVNRAIKLDPELSKTFKNTSVPMSKFITLDEMISSWDTKPPRTRRQPVQGPLTATTPKPVSRPGSKGTSRRAG